MHQTVKSTFSILSILSFFFLSTFVLSRIFFIPFSYQFLPRLQFLSLHHQFESYFIRDKIVSLSSVYSRRIPRRRIWELDFSFSRCREITPNFSRREYSSIMFTPASERSICFFFFYFLFSSFIFYSPPSSISSHVTYTYFIVENTRTSDHEHQERGRGKEKKKSRCWLWHWKEGSMSARRISRYFSTWNRRCTVEIRDDGYDLSSIRIIHLWSIDVNHSRTYFSSVIRKITKFYLLIYAFTWKEKYLFARVLFFFFFN